MGAKVFVGDEERGVTPLKTRVKAIQKNTVRVELDGFFGESATVEPNTNEQTTLHFTLRTASRVRVSSEPPGARVSVGGEVVLEKTPGLTRPLAPGLTQLVVALPGYVAVQKPLTLASREEVMQAKLLPGVKVAVSSVPLGADVRLDGVLVGVTPLELFAPRKGKQTIVISRAGWSSVTKVLSNPKGNEKLSATLVDMELADAKKNVDRARVALDTVSLSLVRLQNEDTVSAALKRRISVEEKLLEERAAQLESAERALKAVQASR